MTEYRDLIHWSARPIEGLLYDRPQVEARYQFKPQGLWLSDDSQYGWLDWCREHDFNPENLAHRTVVRVDMTDVLHLSTPEELLRFTEAFRTRGEFPQGINWWDVAQLQKGVLITPYQWSLRMDMRVFWYYGWDCASGCIWDASCLEILEEAEP